MEVIRYHGRIMAFIFFGNNFKITNMLQEYYKLPYALHPDSPIVNILPHLSLFSLHIYILYFFPNDLRGSCRHNASLTLNTLVRIF